MEGAPEPPAARGIMPLAFARIFDAIADGHGACVLCVLRAVHLL
jgi:hypothetical protein